MDVNSELVNDCCVSMVMRCDLHSKLYNDLHFVDQSAGVSALSYAFVVALLFVVGN